MTVSLPDSLQEFVDERIERRGYGTSSEYVCELLRSEHDLTKLRDLLLQGAASALGKEVGKRYFDVPRRL